MVEEEDEQARLDNHKTSKTQDKSTQHNRQTKTKAQQSRIIMTRPQTGHREDKTKTNNTTRHDTSAHGKTDKTKTGADLTPDKEPPLP